MERKITSSGEKWWIPLHSEKQNIQKQVKFSSDPDLGQHFGLEHRSTPFAHCRRNPQAGESFLTEYVTTDRRNLLNFDIAETEPSFLDSISYCSLNLVDIADKGIQCSAPSPKEVDQGIGYKTSPGHTQYTLSNVPSQYTVAGQTKSMQYDRCSNIDPVTRKEMSYSTEGRSKSKKHALSSSDLGRNMHSSGHSSTRINTASLLENGQSPSKGSNSTRGVH